jgi:hypothetical protein
MTAVPVLHEQVHFVMKEHAFRQDGCRIEKQAHKMSWRGQPQGKILLPSSQQQNRFTFVESAPAAKRSCKLSTCSCKEPESSAFAATRWSASRSAALSSKPLAVSAGRATAWARKRSRPPAALVSTTDASCSALGGAPAGLPQHEYSNHIVKLP